MRHEDHAHTHAGGSGAEGLSTEPQFDPGTRVVLREATPDRYKHRPEYAEGARGVVERVHGAYVPPGEQEEEAPTYEYLYSVRFAHTELWGENHPETNGSVHIDLWETALDRG